MFKAIKKALKKELINDEVIDIAIDFHGILANLTESCPPDCLVDLFTELISLLNKYDASLKVNKDLVNELRDQSKNDMVLTIFVCLKLTVAFRRDWSF